MASAFVKSPVCKWIAYSTTSEKNTHTKPKSQQEKMLLVFLPNTCIMYQTLAETIANFIWIPYCATEQGVQVPSVLVTYITKIHSCYFTPCLAIRRIQICSALIPFLENQHYWLLLGAQDLLCTAPFPQGRDSLSKKYFMFTCSLGSLSSALWLFTHMSLFLLSLCVYHFLLEMKWELTLAKWLRRKLGPDCLKL